MRPLVVQGDVFVSLHKQARLSCVEAGRLAWLAVPVLGAQLAQAAMSTVDIAMTGHVDARHMAAVAEGSSLWLPLVLLMIGTLMGLTPVVAQHVGARRFALIRPAVRQAIWIALVLGSLCSCVLSIAAAPIFTLMRVPPDVTPLATHYLYAVAFGLPAMALYETLRFYSDGLGHTRASLLFALLGLAVNVVANYVLIYGGNGLTAIFGPGLPMLLRGLPALGAVGCGVATALSMWLMFLGMLVYIRIAPVYRATRTGPAAWRPVPALIVELLRLGLPVGVAIFAEVTLFTAITLFIAGFGEVVIAAHTVALNFSSLLFMVPLSLGLALTVRVGQTLGRGKMRHARFVAYNGVFCALLVAFAIDLVLVLAGPWAVALYTANPRVAELAVRLLLLATLYQFSDALQVSIAGALRGYKDTRVIMAVTIVAYWGVGMGLGNLLGRGVAGVFTGLGVYGYWIGLIAGLSTAAALLGRRLRHTTHRARLSASGP